MHPELIYPRGAEKQVCMLSYYLAKFGHDVTIYTFEKKEPYIYDHLLEKVEVYSLKKKWAIGYPSVDVPRWSYLIKKISKKIESKNHEIINAHNHPAQWISYYTKKTVVWSCNEPYLYYQEKRDFKSNFYIWIDKHLSKKVKLILCLDPMMEEIIRSRYLNIKTFVTWSGVELNQEVEHIENDCFDVLFVGPIHPQKRPLDIVKAFTIIKNKLNFLNLKLHFVGEVLSHKLKKDMESISKEFNIELHFYGYVSNETLVKLYSIADLAVFVPEKQPWGIFPLEAILADIPTVISDQCGIRYILPGDFPVIETGNIQQLVDKIIDIIDNYPIYKNKTKIFAKEIINKFSWIEYAKRLEKILESYCE